MLKEDNVERLQILRAEIILNRKIYLYDDEGREYWYTTRDNKRHYTYIEG